MVKKYRLLTSKAKKNSISIFQIFILIILILSFILTLNHITYSRTSPSIQRNPIWQHKFNHVIYQATLGSQQKDVVLVGGQTPEYYGISWETGDIIWVNPGLPSDPPSEHDHIHSITILDLDNNSNYEGFGVGTSSGDPNYDPWPNNGTLISVDLETGNTNWVITNQTYRGYDIYPIALGTELGLGLAVNWIAETSVYHANSGSKLWNWTSPPENYSLFPDTRRIWDLAVTDVTKDGIDEIFVIPMVMPTDLEINASATLLFCLDARNGSIIWEANGLQAMISNLCFLEITHDNIPDILVALDCEGVAAINGASGEIIWENDTPFDEINLCNLPLSNKKALVGGNLDFLYVLDPYTGNSLRSPIFLADGLILLDILSADFNLDGEEELAIATWGQGVWIVALNGTILETYDIQSFIRSFEVVEFPDRTELLCGTDVALESGYVARVAPLSDYNEYSTENGGFNLIPAWTIYSIISTFLILIMLRKKFLK